VPSERCAGAITLDVFRVLLMFSHAMSLSVFRTRMPSVLLVLGMSAMISLQGCGNAFDRSASVSIVECAKRSVDLGALDVEAPATHDATFQLHNNTAEAIEIVSIVTSCGCLAADGYQRSIPPAGDSDINFKLVVAPVPGSFARTAVVRFASAAVPPVVLTVVGSVRTSDKMTSHPESVQLASIVLPNKFGELPSPQLHEDVVVSRYDGKKFTLLPPTTSVDWLTATLSDGEGQPSSRHMIRLHVDPKNAPKGKASATVSLEQLAGATPLSVVVRGYFHPASDLFKRSIVIPELRRGHHHDIDILSPLGIEVLQAESLARLSIAVSNASGISAAMSPARSGALRLTADSSCKEAFFSGQLVISVDGSDEDVAIPLSVLRFVPLDAGDPK
jgi:hypothetical protein